MENLQQFINPKAVEICAILQKAGHQAFIVGGCVRDMILGLKPKDWDITTSATPDKVMLLFPETYPTGLQHGTVTVSMGQGIENHFEITTFRVEGKYLDGRRPEEVTFVENVEDDLSRRDLTINAIAYDPIANELKDPFGGQEDLKRRLIRAVGDPKARFEEDGLRIMRAARFGGRFGYNIEATTMEGMMDSIDTLFLVSRERISDELSKILMSNNPGIGLRILRDCQALKIACPFLTSHSLFMAPIDEAKSYNGDLETRLAYIYSSCPISEIQSELMDLKYSNKEIKRTMFLISLLDKYDVFHKANFIKDGRVRAPESLAAYVSFIAMIKNQSIDPWDHTLNQFITLTESLGLPSKMILDNYGNVKIYSYKEMNINGNDLLEIGIKPGPEIKKILNQCYDKILKEPNHNTKNILISFVKNRSK